MSVLSAVSALITANGNATSINFGAYFDNRKVLES